jgi:hypothetical protein
VTIKHKRTAHINQSTGSRRSKDKRMEVLKERNGSMHQGTLETGRIIKKMVSAFNSIKTVTNMRVYGKEINAMDKGLIGGMKMVNSEESIQATGLKIKNTVEAPSSIKMEIDTMDTGYQECHKERDV